MRNLATVQEINAVEPILGADAIEKVRVLGWWVVVKKGEFRVGSKVVYCEIDSLLPVRPEFEFLRKSGFKPEIRTDDYYRPAGFRIKTVKLRGQVSQGICFPLSILVGVGITQGEAQVYEGQDVTDALGITKYDVPPLGAGGCEGTFPGFLSKTDEIRVQNLYREFPDYQGKSFVVTEKLDGTSYTAFLRAGEFGVCSRNNLVAHGGDGIYAKATALFEVESRLRLIQDRLGGDVAVQGELIGPKIQGNKYGLMNYELRIFNLFDICAGKYVPHYRASELLQWAGFSQVPDLGKFVLDHTVDGLVELSISTSVLNPQVQREGIVLRWCNATPNEVDRVSFKVINPQFLLKYDE